MPNFAHVVIAGHIGGDVETRDAGKTTVTNFSVAVNTGYGDRECTTWWRVSVWGKRGEAAQQYLKKGSAVIISGEPQNRKYDGKNGEAYSLEIGNADWSFAGGKSQAGQSREDAPTVAAEYEDDLPF